MSVNLNSTVPSPPTGSAAVVFQTDGSGNISAYVGAAGGIAVVNLTAQAAAVGTTTLFTTSAAGVYRLSYYLNITTAGNAVNLTGTFGWTDDSGIPATVTTANVACNTAGANSTLIGQPGSLTFYAAAATTITYATALSGAIGVGQYSVRLRLENLQ